MSIKNSAILAAFTLVALAATPVLAAAPPRPAAALTQPAPDATAASSEQRVVLDRDASRYAQRETKAKKQQAYRGGDYLVIGVSTGAAIVILIIVLLLI